MSYRFEMYEEDEGINHVWMNEEGEASRTGEYLNDVKGFLEDGDGDLIAAYEGEYVHGLTDEQLLEITGEDSIDDVLANYDIERLIEEYGTDHYYCTDLDDLYDWADQWDDEDVYTTTSD